MRFGKIYDEAIGLNNTQSDEEAAKVLNPNIISPAEDASRAQRKMDWLASTATEELIKKFIAERDELIAQTIMMGVTYPKHNNHMQIIQNLVKIDSLNKTIEQIKKV